MTDYNQNICKVVNDYARLVRIAENLRVERGFNFTDLAVRLNIEKSYVQKAFHPHPFIPVLKRSIDILEAEPEPGFISSALLSF